MTLKGHATGLTLLVVLYCVSLASSAAALHPCPDPADLTYLDRPALLERLMGPDWIWVGESHIEDSTRFFFDLVLQRSKVRNHQQQCLFLESDYSRYQEILGRCRPDTVKVHSLYVLSCSGEEILIDGAAYIGAALQLGWKVYAVDETNACERYQNESRLWMNCRNRFMADRIRSSLNGCLGGGIVVNGWKHLVTSAEVPSVDRLVANKMKSSVKLRIDTHPLASTSLAKAHCPLSWSQRATPIYFESAQIQASLIDGNERGELVEHGRWLAFALTAFLPNIPESRRLDDIPRLPQACEHRL